MSKIRDIIPHIYFVVKILLMWKLVVSLKKTEQLGTLINTVVYSKLTKYSLSIRV